MEKEPKQVGFNIDNYGEMLHCTPDNTIGYVFDDPEQDHIFYIKEESGEGAFGYHIFRGNLKSSFDQMIDYMRANDFQVYDDAEFTEGDQQALNKYKALITIKEYEARELSKRQKAKVKFLRYILKKELLIDEDFVGKGELYI